MFTSYVDDVEKKILLYSHLVTGEVYHLQCADIEAYDCPGVDPNLYDKMFCGKTTDINNPVGACKVSRTGF